MKQTVSTRLISFLLVLAMVLSMVPTAPIHAHAALTSSEIDELNDKWNLDIEFNPDNPDETPEEAMSTKSDAKQHIDDAVLVKWCQFSKQQIEAIIVICKFKRLDEYFAIGRAGGEVVEFGYINSYVNHKVVPPFHKV